MTLRMLWPLWALLAVFVPLLALCVWQLRASQGERRLDWARRTAMVACVAVIGLCPSVPTMSAQGVTSNAELYFVVDRTGSMAAEDYNGDAPRLDGVAADMIGLTRELAGSRYAILAFDSQSTRQLPLTTDARAVRSWAETVTQELTTFSAGSAIDRPLDQLRTTLEEAAERNPSNIRLVFFLSDGENTQGSGSGSGGDNESFEDLAPLIDGGAVLGYGTTEGGQMRSYDGTAGSGPGSDAPYIIDADGDPAVSSIDEDALRTIAQQMGILYSHRFEPGNLAPLVQDIDLQDIANDGRRDLTTYSDVYWPFAIVLALLLSWEAWNLSRVAPKKRRGKDRERPPPRDRELTSVGRGSR